MPIPELNLRFTAVPAGISINGSQLQGCEDIACSNPILWLSQGKCQGEACLPTNDQRLVANDDRITIDNNQAIRFRDFRSADQIPTPLVRVVVQFDDQVRVSQPFQPFQTYVYYADFRDEPLQLRPYEPFPPGLDAGQPLQLIPVLMMTLGLEIVIGLEYVHRRKITPLPYLGVVLLLINLISFPLIWSFFPMVGDRVWLNLGLLGAVTTGLEAGALYGIYHQRIILRESLLISLLLNSISSAVGIGFLML